MGTVKDEELDESLMIPFTCGTLHVGQARYLHDPLPLTENRFCHSVIHSLINKYFLNKYCVYSVHTKFCTEDKRINISSLGEFNVLVNTIWANPEISVG